MITIDWKLFLHDRLDFLKDYIIFGWYWKEDNGDHWIEPRWERMKGTLKNVACVPRERYLIARWKHEKDERR